jgi:ADP-dependent phosphofructokinase/glucokinase
LNIFEREEKKQNSNIGYLFEYKNQFTFAKNNTEKDVKRSSKYK